MTSAFPSGVIGCPVNGCGATVSAVSPDRADDDMTVDHLRVAGWQVVAGAWVCPRHLPRDRKVRNLPNPHCSKCGTTRGGPYGHEAYECTGPAA